MKESEVQKAIHAALGGRGDTRLFRQNTGQAWQGNKVERWGQAVIIHDARPLQAGLCPGSSDLIGWHCIEITPAMVGQRLGAFLAVEVKRPGGKPPTQKQQRFLEAVQRMGGLAGVARSVEDAEAILAPDGTPARGC